MKKKKLTLTISKQWFDMIADGRKNEEYREIKPYWASRLVNQQAEGGEVLFDEYGGYCCVTGEPEYKPYDVEYGDYIQYQLNYKYSITEEDLQRLSGIYNRDFYK